MCRFLSLDFACTIACPFDRHNHQVRFQAWPGLRGHALDVVSCDAASEVGRLVCAKNCRTLIENEDYWLDIYSENAQYG